MSCAASGAGTQLTCEDRAEGEDPTPDALVRDGDAALGQQVLDIAEAQCEAQIQPDRALDDFAREAVAGIGEHGHATRLRCSPVLRKPAGQPKRDKPAAELLNGLEMRPDVRILSALARWQYRSL